MDSVRKKGEKKSRNYNLDVDMNAVYKLETGNYDNFDMTRIEHAGFYSCVHLSKCGSVKSSCTVARDIMYSNFNQTWNKKKLGNVPICFINIACYRLVCSALPSIRSTQGRKTRSVISLLFFSAINPWDLE